MTNTRDEEFRTYVQGRRNHLVRTATFLTSGDRHAAEDLVQTALMRLYVAWPRVRADTVDAYARKSMLNAMIDSRRRPFARFERSRAQLPEVAVTDEPLPDLDTAVFTALAALPPRMRAAVVLRHLLELTVAETADALRCSEGTVKSQTARALTQLRDALQPELRTAVPPDPTTQLPAPPGLRTDGDPPVDLRHAEDLVRIPDLGDLHE